ncbi:hypothetical protein, partial [Saccharococcus caldoxylosilyticus]
TEVKLSSADGSWGQRPCKSRSSLGRMKKHVFLMKGMLLFLPHLFIFLSLTICKTDIGVSFLAKKDIL